MVQLKNLSLHDGDLENNLSQPIMEHTKMMKVFVTKALSSHKNISLRRIEEERTLGWLLKMMNTWRVGTWALWARMGNWENESTSTNLARCDAKNEWVCPFIYSIGLPMWALGWASNGCFKCVSCLYLMKTCSTPLFAYQYFHAFFLSKSI